MVAPKFYESTDALDYYSKKGGLVGISRTVIDKFYSYRDEIIRRANEIWLRAFPRGKPITDIREITRRIGIFRARAKEKPELRPLLEEYERIATLARRWRESEPLVKELERVTSEYHGRQLDLKDRKEDWEYILGVIRRVHALITTLHSRLGIFEEEYWLSQLFIQHNAILYLAYEGGKAKERHVNYIFRAYAHAELLYLDRLYAFARIGSSPLHRKEFDICALYAAVCQYCFMVDIKTDLDFGIDVEHMKYDYGFKDYPAELETEDIDYNEIRESYPTTLPWDWPILHPIDILEMFGFNRSELEHNWPVRL